MQPHQQVIRPVLNSYVISFLTGMLDFPLGFDIIK